MNVMVRRAGRMFKEGKSEASGHCLLTEGNLIFFNVFQMSSHVMPVPLYAIPGPLVHQSSMMGYPLIPAPLGQVPSPIIPPPNRKVGLSYLSYHY